MPDGADVRSIDAVRDWHAALAEYADMLAESLAGVELEIRRAHEWLAEQQSLWQRAVKKCEEDVVRAKAELSQRKFQTFDGREPDCSVQEKNLRVARARLEHAEDQVEKCRQWIQRLPRAIDEAYTGPARRLASRGARNAPGASRPSRGWRQRISASAPTILRSERRTCGW